LNKPQALHSSTFLEQMNPVADKFAATWSNLRYLLIGLAFLGAGLAIYGLWQGHYTAKMIGFGLMGIAVTIWWPEFTLLALLGGTNEHSSFLLSTAQLASSGPILVVFAGLLAAGATPLLIRRGVLRLRRPGLTWPLLLVSVMSLWIFLYLGFGRTWASDGIILNNYVFQGVFVMLVLWYLAFSQSANIVATAKRLLWATVFVNAGGFLVNMLVTAGSFAPLFDPSSHYWSLDTAGLFVIAGQNHISLAVDIFAPPLLAALALILSSSVGRAVKISLAGLILIFGTLILASGTRQAVVAGVLALIVMLLLTNFGWKGRFQVVGIVVFIILVSRPAYDVFVSTFGSNGIEHIATLAAPGVLASGNYRLSAAQQDIQLFLQNPFFGQGLGIGSVANGASELISHNILTSIGAEVGIIPLLATLGFLAAIFHSIWNLARFSDLSPAERVGFQGLAGLFVFNLAASMISGRMEGGFAFFGYGAGLYFLYRFARDQRMKTSNDGQTALAPSINPMSR